MVWYPSNDPREAFDVAQMYNLKGRYLSGSRNSSYAYRTLNNGLLNLFLPAPLITPTISGIVVGLKILLVPK